MGRTLNSIRLHTLVVAEVARSVGLQRAIDEYRFDPVRRWRFDIAWPDWKVALEVEGAVMRYRTRPDGTREYIGGRHTRGEGAVRDMEKYDTAAIDGWCVIRCTWRQVDRLDAARQVIDAIRRRMNAHDGMEEVTGRGDGGPVA
jgi:very-short-patch-repair endonuclease